MAALQGSRPPAGKTCLLDSGATIRAADTGIAAGPLLAETQLERASLLARAPGIADEVVLRDYDQAVDSLIRSGAAGGIIQPSLEAYQIGRAHV